MRIHLKTLGCRLNEAELESWASDFNARGHQVVNDVCSADILVINTCAVTQNAVRKSRQLVRKAHKKNPKAKLVISGCYATLNENEATAIDGVDLLINNAQKDKLVELTLKQLNTDVMPTIATEPGEIALFSRGRQRAFIKVQDGCRYRCTFCIVTIARGEEKSKLVDDIINEINLAHESGIKEIIVTGVHLGGYGSDTNSNLYELIHSILEQTNVPRIRMGSLEPWDLPENFFSLFSNDRLLPHMHLPIQSGSDSVLRRMARRCKTDEFRQLAINAKKLIPNLNITTDIIVGFPGETDEEWQQTLDFVAEMQFANVHIFTYSKREGTKAAGLINQVDEKIKKARSQALHKLVEGMKYLNIEQMIGQETSILWEDKLVKHDSKRNSYLGYTANYTRVKTTTDVSIELTNHITINKIVAIEDGMPYVEINTNP
ncbi:MAG: tRNA (N(6)-L-threonylcarbamoyladenosine(37)-C(2))-methylthiotransferase MtaB [Piscirickettsiaceae bacterium]|nr:MAG: tRNA (N(6)-L-threonylcarbamoyladenosine(37)-C(2))-methylthiotransferase MtaB [Piscirickettsiaceae bacterium]